MRVYNEDAHHQHLPEKQMTAAVLDDEMEAMLREIEGMGMTPEAPVAAAAPAPAPKPAPAPAAEKVDDLAGLEAALNDIQDIEDSPAIAAIADSVNMDDIDAAVAAIEAEHAVKPPTSPAPTAAPKVTAADLAKKRLKEEGFIEPAAKTTAPEPEVIPPAPEADYTEPPVNPKEIVPKPAVSAKTAPPARVTAPSSHDILDPEQVKKDISINPTDLDSALIEHPGLQMHYALKTADARRAYERLKSGVEILEAKLDASYRDKLFDGGKKPTEAAIRNAVVADPQYATAQAKLIDAQHLWKMCEAVESSFHSRKDILLEVARDRRKEKEGAMRVMEDSELRDKVGAMMRKA
jgi:hypothetical protein